MRDRSRAKALPDQTVAEVLEAWPGTIRVFLEHRMDCVGCSMSGFDTIAEAVANYGGALDTFLAELARAAADPEFAR